MYFFLFRTDPCLCCLGTPTYADGDNCNTHRKLRRFRIAFVLAKGNVSVCVCFPLQLSSASNGREGDAGNAWDFNRLKSRNGHQRRVAVFWVFA